MKGGEICLHEMKYCKLLLFFKEVHNIGWFHEDILNLNLLFLFPKLWWVGVCVCLVLDVVLYMEGKKVEKESSQMLKRTTRVAPEW